MSERICSGLFAGFLFACLLLGGASREGYLGNFILQVCGLGFLFWGLYHLRWGRLVFAERGFLLLVGLGLVVGAAQFVPLSQDVWRNLPGREAIFAELNLLEVRPNPGYVTSSPGGSLRSITWALPAIGIGIALLSTRKLPSSAIALTLVATALLSLVVGIMQVLGSRETPWYFYDFTNRGYMTGFFANANHMATLLLTSLPFLSALVRECHLRFPDRKKELVVLGGALFALIAMGIILVGSLTGYALLGPVALASALIVWRPPIRVAGLFGLLGLMLCAALLAFMGDRENVFASDARSSLVGREQIRGTGLDAAADFFPLGSGLGTFEYVYRRYEDEAEVTGTFINHAHNDYLEIVIELGAPGVALVALFIFWWLYCLRGLLIAEASPFGWAGWIVIGIILTHSGWDYPLRTAALGAVFVMACVFAARPRSIGEQSPRGHISRSDYVRQRIVP